MTSNIRIVTGNRINWATAYTEITALQAYFSSGVATVVAGGTGRATLTSHGVLIGAGTSGLAATSAGTAGQFLVSGGASADPVWATGGPFTATMVAAAGAANVCSLTVTIKDAAGVAMAVPSMFALVLSDSATAATLTGTTTSGTVASTTGYDVVDYTAKKAKLICTNASGVALIAITDTGKTAFYPWVFVGGKGIVGTQLITGNYG